MKNKTTYNLTKSAVILAIIIALAFVPGIPIGPVPITIQNAGIILAILLLDLEWLVGVLFTWLLLIALGLPFATGGTGGFGLFTTPRGGYLIGYFLAAVIVGLIKIPIAHHIKKHENKYVYAFGIFLGLAVISAILVDFFGGVGMMFYLGMSFKASMIATSAFVPLDLVKCFVVSLIAPSIYYNTRK
ncbi:MAG: biotin transporter BioY [Lactobacillales bacterium]|jgi:biotin transport system substrate-specific component|nr:biotin transporter BioY [Lactobacillales bacterium]